VDECEECGVETFVCSECGCCSKCCECEPDTEEIEQAEETETPANPRGDYLEAVRPDPDDLTAQLLARRGVARPRE
jgi:hypothetical protein